MTAGKPRGLQAARKLRVSRRDNRWADKSYKKRALGNIYKTSPTGGSSHAKGIVLEKVSVISMLMLERRSEPGGIGANRGQQKMVRELLDGLEYGPVEGWQMVCNLANDDTSATVIEWSLAHLIDPLSLGLPKSPHSHPATTLL